MRYIVVAVIDIMLVEIFMLRACCGDTIDIGRRRRFSRHSDVALILCCTMSCACKRAHEYIGMNCTDESYISLTTCDVLAKTAKKKTQRTCY